MYYALGSAGEEPRLFRTAAGKWTNKIDDAEHLTIEQAVEKLGDLADLGEERVMEICEAPKMHEAIYADISRRFDELQEHLREHEIFLEYEIGESDETTWKITFDRAGVALVLKLVGPDAFEVLEN